MNRLIDLLKDHRRLLWRLTQMVLVLVSMIFLGVEFRRNLTAVRATTLDLNWFYVMQATGLLIAAWSIIAIPSYIALRHYTPVVTYHQAALIFCISQLAKYLPGGLWAIPGRMVLYQQYYQLRTTLALYLVLWETFALLVGAILVGMIALSALPTSSLQLGWLGLAVVSTLMLHLGSRSPHIRARMIQIVPRLEKRLPDDLAGYAALTPRTLRLMVGTSGLFWLLTGLSFHQLVIAVTYSSVNVGWLDSIGIYAMAWSVGFMVVFVPAGIGIREGTLVLLIAPLVTDSQAVVIAILARLWWTIAEAVWIVAALLMRKFSPKP